MDTLLGALGAVLLAVVGWVLLKKERPGAPERGVGDQVQEAGRLAEEARSGAARASEAREAADDAAVREVMGRPHTDDAVADLEARLRPGSHGHGPGEPAPPSDRTH